MTPDEIAAWHRNLKDTFRHNGVVAGRIMPAIQQQEHLLGAQFVDKYKGHVTLIDCFEDFFAFTMRRLHGAIDKHDWPASAEHYMTCFVSYLMFCRTFRSAVILSRTGHPLSGYALLRDAKDQAFALAAVAGNISSFAALLGVTDPSASENKIHASKLNEEKRILDLLIGKRSELSAGTITDLEQWNRLFNRQVHRASFSFFRELDLWREERFFSIAAREDEDACAIFINTSHEVAWMGHRLLPFMQHPSEALDEDWAHQWRALDQSFHFVLKERANSGKRLTKAILDLIAAKFAFNPNMKYVER